MLREGTKSRSSVQIAEEVDRLGVTLRAGGSFGSSQVLLSASGLSDNFDSWFALAVDVLLNPSFPPEELEKLKQRQRAQLRQQRSAANFLVNERFNRAVYGDHPAAIVSPTLESLNELTQEALMKWYRERYAPQNALLAIAGDVRAQELIPRLEKWFSGWQRTDVKRTWPANPVAATARKIYLVHRPNSVQTTVALGNIAIERRSPDYIPMVVMNHILGGGVAGRLFLNLREEKGYTYGVYSDFSALRYPGPWRAGGNMRTEVTAGYRGVFQGNPPHQRPNCSSGRIGRQQTGHRGALCTVAGTADGDPRTCGFARSVPNAGGLLGYVPSENHGGDCGGRATGGA